MSHVGVERLPAGDHEKDGAEDDVAVPAVAEEEGGTLRGVDGRKHGRVPQDLRGAKRREHEEPDERDGTEDRPDAGGPAALEEEQRDEDRGRDRHDVRPRTGVATVSPSTALSTEIAGVMMPSP